MVNPPNPSSSNPPKDPKQNDPKPDDPRLTKNGEVYEMLWDCRFCGTTKLLAKTQRFCPSCGSPQDPSWRYFPSDDEKIAVKDHVYVGADRVCPACGTLNSANSEFCPRCGSPQTEAAKIKQLGTRTAAIGQKLTQEDLNARQDAEAAIAVSGIPQDVKPASGLKRWQIALIGVVILAIAGGAFAIFSTKSTTVTVSDFRWERSIAIEQLNAVNDKVVCGSMPSDAYAVTRRREQVDTKQVQDGETCSRQQVDNGDGTFREQQVCQPKYRDEPVYGDMCYYTVDRWQVSRQAQSQGDKSSEPVWANTSISRSGSCRGCEREGDRSESYILVLKGDGGKTYECAVKRDVWDSTKQEAVFNLEVGRVLNDARCDTLKPAS
ncbi:MAG TPA: zinc ribbon domain-containing protein [Phototrophicaceae bacterium]|nr:zinc ribbon domain-containing protein [Phototrophicaceae bacterium]